MQNNETEYFVGYDYLSINVKTEKVQLYIDCYENFGWNFINKSGLVDKEDYYINNYNERNQVNIKFKRDRKIKNKTELLSLQRKLDKALKEIDKLENEPVVLGTIYALTISIIGIAFLILSIFSFATSNPFYIRGIICSIITIISWILPYIVYKKIKKLKEEENIILIDEKYNIVYESCKEAKKIINMK